MISRVAEVLAPQTQNDEDARRKEIIRALHHNDHAPEAAHAFATVGYFVLVALIIWSWQVGIWPVTILLWGVAGHLGHSKLIAFHESSHGTLSPRWFMNELQGIFIGAVILVPLSAYRYVHGQHHAYIGTERDLELWPFVLPKVKRPGAYLPRSVNWSSAFSIPPWFSCTACSLAAIFLVLKRFGWFGNTLFALLCGRACSASWPTKAGGCSS